MYQCRMIGKFAIKIFELVINKGLGKDLELGQKLT